VERAAAGLPAVTGDPIEVEFRRGLTVIGGKLHSEMDRGMAVHAASYLVSRHMILDRELLCYPKELRRIIIHELFHFVWRRLGNPKRLAWEDLLRSEMKTKAKGELGWSSEWRKEAMLPEDVRGRSLRWRHYACESFCDTAAWVWGPGHAEHTLARRFRELRRVWMQRIARGPLSI
jgi:hypothetical protein